MQQQYSYNLSDAGNIAEDARNNKKREDKITAIIDDALSQYKDQFSDNDITYEIRFLQGNVELEVFNLEKDTDLGMLVDKSMIGIGTLIGASEH